MAAAAFSSGKAKAFSGIASTVVHVSPHRLSTCPETRLEAGIRAHPEAGNLAAGTPLAVLLAENLLAESLLEDLPCPGSRRAVLLESLHQGSQGRLHLLLALGVQFLHLVQQALLCPDLLALLVRLPRERSGPNVRTGRRVVGRPRNKRR